MREERQDGRSSVSLLPVGARSALLQPQQVRVCQSEDDDRWSSQTFVERDSLNLANKV